MRNNVFSLLRLPRYECWNDRIIAWLCDPAGGHGIEDFAARIIRHLWKRDFQEGVEAVEEQPSLGPECRPDMIVRFNASRLIFENKIASSALKPGKVQQQFDYAVQSGVSFFHVLLFPDTINVAKHCVASEQFRALRYSSLRRLFGKYSPPLPTSNRK